MQGVCTWRRRVWLYRSGVTDRRKTVDFYVLDTLAPGLEVTTRVIKQSTPEQYRDSVESCLSRFEEAGKVTQVRKDRWRACVGNGR